jgi:hypothetical protein
MPEVRSLLPGLSFFNIIIMISGENLLFSKLK